MKAVLFDASEIYQFAVRIEENGERLYRKVAKRTTNLQVRDLFLFLADEDVKHRKQFAELLSKLEKQEPRESYPGEYAAYMTAYTNEIIFPATVTKELPPAEDSIAALDFGIRRELDSIMYYLEMKNFVPEHQEQLIQRIIDEERGHFLKFSELKKQLTAQAGPKRDGRRGGQMTQTRKVR